MKKTGFNPGFITKTFFKGWDPDMINMGRCFQWAWMCYKTYDHVQLWGTDSHAFVKYRGKFYDSERLMGVVDWRDLPACNFGKGLSWNARKEDVGNFKFLWHDSCYMRFKTGWDELDSQVKKVLNND